MQYCEASVVAVYAREINKEDFFEFEKLVAELSSEIVPKIIKKQPVGQELATGFKKIHEFLGTALKRSGEFDSSSEDDKQDEIHNQAI